MREKLMNQIKIGIFVLTVLGFAYTMVKGVASEGLQMPVETFWPCDWVPHPMNPDEGREGGKQEIVNVPIHAAYRILFEKNDLYNLHEKDRWDALRSLVILRWFRLRDELQTMGENYSYETNLEDVKEFVVLRAKMYEIDCVWKAITEIENQGLKDGK
jgi:hypothetical protein